jgi:hypothetical protein
MRELSGWQCTPCRVDSVDVARLSLVTDAATGLQMALDGHKITPGSVRVA